jgi:TPR repeat protein
VKQDYKKAVRLYRLAAEQGDENAVESRNKLNNMMTPEQVAKGQRLAGHHLVQNYKGC